jgi:hypothetical protein
MMINRLKNKWLHTAYPGVFPYGNWLALHPSVTQLFDQLAVSAQPAAPTAKATTIKHISTLVFGEEYVSIK